MLNMSQHKCGWCVGDALYEAYHDKEWGVPVYNDKTWYEFLVLESFQAGLSWITILRKRENFREAFDDFQYKKVAAYNEKKIQELLNNAKIVRNEMKIRAAVNNASAFLTIQDEFGSFSDYVWGFVDHKPQQNTIEKYKDAPAKTNTSEALSKDLKKRGFKFIGPTVAYATMQATGMVNDHEVDCYRHSEIKTEYS